jgi:cytochrome c oxidase subunit 4
VTSESVQQAEQAETVTAAGEHAHPDEAQYVKIALVLAVVTAIEVGLYYTDFGVNLTNGLLLVLAAIKFAMVAAYFMHLKFDNPILRRLFVGGLVLAATVYIAALLTFGVFIT